MRFFPGVSLAMTWVIRSALQLLHQLRFQHQLKAYQAFIGKIQLTRPII
jgi:hypothetical protein